MDSRRAAVAADAAAAERLLRVASNSRKVLLPQEARCRPITTVAAGITAPGTTVPGTTVPGTTAVGITAVGITAGSASDDLIADVRAQAGDVETYAGSFSISRIPRT
jgi:hypothetical protein